MTSVIDRRVFLAFASSVVAGVVPRRASASASAGALAASEFTVGPVRRTGREGERYFEPWIAANPRDGANLVVVASRYLGQPATRRGEPMEPAAWYTADGGATWSSGALEGTDRLRDGQAFFADSYATYAPDGTAFCVFAGSPEGNRLDLWVYRSDDGGRHWRGPTVLTRGLDYPRLAADLKDGKPRLFVAVAVDGSAPIFGDAKRSGYGCAVLRSDDGARTFSVVNFLAPTTLQHDPIDSPLMLPDGRLLVGFADYPADPREKGPRGSITHGRIHAAVSRDGGATFSTPVPICDTLIQDGYVALAVDRSEGPRRGRIYAVRHSRTSRPPGLEVQTSEDGAVWTPPASVPNLRAGPIPHAAAAVSSRGAIGLAWIQGEPGDNVRIFDKEWTGHEHRWDLYFTASADGGATFLAEPLRITSSRTDPTLGSRPYGTDYIALAAPPDGSFHLVWVNTQDGQRAVQAVKIGPAESFSASRLTP
jgi:hypothetical protein